MTILNQKNLLVTALLLAIPSASATDDNFTFKAQAQAGYQHDSNVNIKELDNNTEQSDNAWVMQGQAIVQWHATDALQAEVGISHLDTSYHDFADFDLAITTIHGDISYAFEPLTVGLSQHSAKAKLAGNHFMDYTQSSLYAARLFNQRWYVRAEAQNIDKTFNEFSERNAKADAYSGDLYWFSKDALTFINLGYGVHDENAQDAALSYKGYNYRAKWQTQTGNGNLKHTWQLGWQLQQRDYQSDTSLLGEKRNERRHSISGQWQIPLSNNFSIINEVEYVDNQSNLESSDYQETLATMSLRFSF